MATKIDAGVDFYYVCKVTKYKKDKYKKTEGSFYIVKKKFVCSAVSGSGGTKFCVPMGTYGCRKFKDRIDSNMTRDEIGFSVELDDMFDPELGRKRTLMRIHPDGGFPGTAGCIGIVSQVEKCRDYLQDVMPAGSERKLKVIILSKGLPIPQTVSQVLNS